MRMISDKLHQNLLLDEINNLTKLKVLKHQLRSLNMFDKSKKLTGI
jgi:hypothetical protein